jgi:diguanylate cyclase (GGDEF)-like protein
MNGGKLLYVDDDGLMRRGFALLAKARGLDVECVSSSIDALAALERERRAVVVTDLRMPGMDGIALVDRIREMYPTTATIVVTGVPEIDLHRGRGFEDVLAVLGKPWDSACLLAWIRRAFDLHAALESRARGVRPALVVHRNAETGNAIATEIEAHLGAPCPSVTSFGEILPTLIRVDPRIVAVDAHLLAGFALGRLAEALPRSVLIALVDDDGDELGRSLLGRASDYLRSSEASGRTLERALRYATALEDKDLRMAQIGSRDVVTGLPNRTSFCNTLAARIERCERTAVLMIDIDRFEDINDSLGHAAADDILREIGHRLRSALPEAFEVARIGGDAFGVMLCGSDGDDLERRAEQVLAAFRGPFGADGVELTACAGAAHYPSSGATLDAVLQAVEASLTAAKRRGRSSIQVGHARSAPRSSKLGLERELHKGLESDRYVLHYQEQRDLRSGRSRGAEALLRFRRSDGSLVSPAEFIPILEDSDLILDVGAWVIEAACRKAAEWHRAGDRLVRVGVNLSARQFERPGLVKTVADAISAAGIPSRALELEITEGLLMRDTEATNTTLAGLKELGANIAIDDFGTGYSSLAYLHRFDIDVMKVDRSFVQMIDGAKSAGSIASGIIDLGHRLHLEVIAEGVETVEQLQFLRKAECDGAQGYYFARPVECWSPEVVERTPKEIARPVDLLEAAI